MKRAILYLGLIMVALLTYTCYEPSKISTEDLLSSNETQGEVFEAISNNHELMTNMINHMIQNEHAMEMYKGNSDFMTKMMSGDMEMMKMNMMNMMNMMERDSVLCSNMQSLMMNNEHMRSMMMQMMHQEGMMKATNSLPMHVHN